MNITQIKYVLEVAAASSMREASTRLYVSQPALSASIRDLENELGISPNLMQYISNPDHGCGLLKFGNRVIPIDGRLPHDSEMYKLFNTNFHELSAIRRKKLKKEGREMETMLRLT